MFNKLLAQIPHNNYGLSGPGQNPNSPKTATSALELTVGRVIGILTVVAVIYFSIQIIFAGYAYISSEGDAKKAQDAKKRLTDGILGLFIVVVSLGLGALMAKLLGLENVLDLNSMFDKLGL
ncbi:MAG: hypothetical protein WCV93_01040 [Candidatus Shapirobacteria bacterium]|jgi:phosphatidylglycerophosphatase A